MRKNGLAFLALLLLLCAASQSQIISTVAGGGPNNVPALSTSIGVVSSVARDNAGDLFVLVGPSTGVTVPCQIYRVSPAGQLTLVAGSGRCGFGGDGGLATDAELNIRFDFYYFSEIAVDTSGDLFIADFDNDRIREVVAATGKIQTVAGNGTSGFSGDGGPATSAELNGPMGVAVDSSGNLFIADTSNQRVREVVAATGKIQTVAGNGTAGPGGDGGLATNAQLDNPTGLAIDSSGNLFIADAGNERIRKVTAGKIQTVAGNGIQGFSGDGGPATSAELGFALSVAVDGSGNLFITDIANQRIREVASATGIIQTVAGGGTAGLGDGGPATSATLNYPLGAAVDGSGNVFIADGLNYRVREVSASTGIIQTVAGNGSYYGFTGDGYPATGAELNNPTYLTVDNSGNLFIDDQIDNRVRGVTSDGIIRTVAGNGNPGFSGDGGPAAGAELCAPQSVAADSAGNLFIADGCNYRVREVVAATGIIQTVAGNGTYGFSGDGGPATDAELSRVYGVAVDQVGNLFILDDSRVRKVAAASGIIQTITSAGGGGNGDGLAVDGSGKVFVTVGYPDCDVLEVIAATGVVQVVAGTNGVCGYSGDGGPATMAQLHNPFGVAVDGSGNIFIGDSGNARVREVVAATGIIQTAAGNGGGGFSGDGGPATNAELSALGVFLDRSGNLFIADNGNERVRRVTVPPVATTTTLTVSPQSSGSVTVTYGTPATLTATIASTGSPQPYGGPVTFYDGGNVIGSALVGANSTAALSSLLLPAGTHLLSAAYGGFDQYQASTSTGVTEVISKANASISLSSSQNPSVQNQSVTFTVTVSGPAGTTPSGMLTFQDGATALKMVGLTLGTAMFATSSLSLGAHSITASYSGDGNFNAGTSAPLVQEVLIATSIALKTAPNPSTFNQSVTLTATIMATSGTPNSGTVAFMDGSTLLSSVPVSAGAAVINISTLAAGSHALTAVYSGDGTTFNGSTSSVVMQVVSGFSFSVTLSHSPALIHIGETGTSTATLTNNSGVTVNNVAFGLSVTGGRVYFVSGSFTVAPGPGSGGCDVTGNPVTCNIGTMHAGDVATITLMGVATLAHDLLATASANATTTTATDSVKVRFRPFKN